MMASATWLATASSSGAPHSLSGNFPRPICAPFPMPHGAGGAPCAPGAGFLASVIPTPCDAVRSVETSASAGGIVGVQVVACSPSARSYFLAVGLRVRSPVRRRRWRHPRRPRGSPNHGDIGRSSPSGFGGLQHWNSCDSRAQGRVVPR
jgi:hypothetical protein